MMVLDDLGFDQWLMMVLDDGRLIVEIVGLVCV